MFLGGLYEVLGMFGICKKGKGSIMPKKNLRSCRMLLTAQTVYNLFRLAAMAGYGQHIVRVVDKLVRDKMLELRGDNNGIKM